MEATPPILELKPSAPVVVRRARTLGREAGAPRGADRLVPRSSGSGSGHFAALVRLQTKDIRTEWRSDDTPMRGFLAIGAARNYSYFAYRLYDEDLESLRDVFRLRSLDLSSCDHLTDASMTSIAAVKPLRELFVSRIANPAHRRRQGPPRPPDHRRRPRPHPRPDGAAGPLARRHGDHRRRPRQPLRDEEPRHARPQATPRSPTPASPA